MKILFVHLLNNYTGSPKVLRQLLYSFSNNSEYECHLLTSKTEGFLSGLENVSYHYNCYSWSDNKFCLAIKLFFAHVIIFFKVLLFKKVDVVYINTILPFSASVAARLRRIPIVYHVHEVYVKPNAMHKLCFNIMKLTAKKYICVSDYVKNNVCSENAVTVYNSVLPVDSNFKLDIKDKFSSRILLMPSSLKEYKGVFQFVRLSEIMPDYNFLLVCSADKNIVDFYFKDKLPSNLTVYSRQENMSEFYKKASVVLNLSLPDRFIETFGMTLIEGMQYGCPVIAPDAGGPKEIIDSGKNGFLINPYEIDKIKCAVESIFLSEKTYEKFSYFAFNSADRYSYEKFISEIDSILKEI